jgi:hypothetical protein
LPAEIVTSRTRTWLAFRRALAKAISKVSQVRPAGRGGKVNDVEPTDEPGGQ